MNSLPEILIPPSFTFSLDTLAESPSRDRFLSVVQPVDPKALEREQANNLLNTMKMAFMVFGQKMTSLENDMALREARFNEEVSKFRAELATFRLEAEVRESKLQAELREAKLQAELRDANLQAELREANLQAQLRDAKLQAQLREAQLQAEAELKQARHEVEKHCLSKERMDKVIELAKVMDGDQYRPYALRVALSNTDFTPRHTTKLRTSSPKPSKKKTPLPADFDQRLAKAYTNGFKWRNNVVPVKNYKKLEKLVEWEKSFQAGLDLEESRLLDVDHVFLQGSGAESAALLRLQQFLKVDLVKEFPESNRHNLYQKAVKMVLENSPSDGGGVSKHYHFVEKYWSDQPDNIKSSIVNLFDGRGLSLKTFKLCTTQTVQPSPQVFPYDEGDLDSDDRWTAIRDGRYDRVIEGIVTSWA